MISGCVVRLWRRKIKESNATAQRAHKLLRYSKNFNYSLNASRDEIEFWPCVRHRWMNTRNARWATTPRILWIPENGFPDTTFKKYFEIRSLFNFQSRIWRNLFVTESLREIFIPSIVGSEPFCTSTFVIRPTRMFHCSFLVLVSFLFFFFFWNNSAQWKNSRTTIVFVFTIIKKGIVRGKRWKYGKELSL